IRRSTTARKHRQTASKELASLEYSKTGASAPTIGADAPRFPPVLIGGTQHVPLSLAATLGAEVVEEDGYLTIGVDGDVLDLMDHEVRQRAMSDHAEVMLERFLQSVLSIEFVVEGFVAGIVGTRDGAHSRYALRIEVLADVNAACSIVCEAEGEVHISTEHHRFAVA